MSISRIILVCLFFMFTTFLISCTSREPVIPSDAITNIKTNLGYVLAPTYLPKGYEYNPEGFLISDSKAVLMYENEHSGQSPVQIAMIYPLADVLATFVFDIVDLEIPEDAITEVKINNSKAYSIQGSWSNDTLQRISRLEEPINPKWDYEGGKTIHFATDVPGEGEIWVSLRTIMPTDEVSNEDLIRIARSVVVVR